MIFLGLFVGFFAIHELLGMCLQLCTRVGVLLEKRFQVRMFRQVIGIVNQAGILGEIGPDVFVLVELGIPIAQL